MNVPSIGPMNESGIVAGVNRHIDGVRYKIFIYWYELRPVSDYLDLDFRLWPRIVAASHSNLKNKPLVLV